MKLYPIYTALTNLSDVHGVELDEDTFLVYAMSAYRRIGNRISKMKLLRARPQKDREFGWYVCIPEDCEAIEVITLPFEDAQITSNVANGVGWFTHPIEQTIEHTKHNHDELYIPGKIIPFNEVGNKIYFTEPYPLVNILYKGSYSDDEGLPFITEKEADAIALYCAYCFYYKKALSTKDNITLQFAQMLYKQWQQAVSQARIPQDISQNEVNQILDVMTSHGRHMFGRTTKPVI